MTSIKIECGCGQHYAFDAEPENGRMTTTVACPACGADGTEAANAFIASRQPDVLFPTAPIAPPPRRIKVPVPSANLSAPKPPPGVRLDATALGLVDRETAETQARAKISWGDSPDEVTKYLMLQGFTVPEAQELVAALFKERLADLRKKGIGKIFTGFGMMWVPVIEYATFAHIGFISLKLMAVGVMVALWGLWQLLNGILLLIAPKMESGAVGDD